MGPWSAISGAADGVAPAGPAAATAPAAPAAGGGVPAHACGAACTVTLEPVELPSASVEPPPQAASMAVVAAAIVARSGRKGTETWWRVMRIRWVKAQLSPHLPAWEAACRWLDGPGSWLCQRDAPGVAPAMAPPGAAALSRAAVLTGGDTCRSARLRLHLSPNPPARVHSCGTLHTLRGFEARGADAGARRAGVAEPRRRVEYGLDASARVGTGGRGTRRR